MLLKSGCVVFLFLLFFSVGCFESWMQYGCIHRSTDVFDLHLQNENSTTIRNVPQASSRNPNFLSVFDFAREPVMVIDCLRDNPMSWMMLRTPVILKRCQFFNKALKWDTQYLSKELTDEYGVSISQSRKFLYYDTTVDYEGFKKAGWRPPYIIQYHSFERFLQIASELAKANNGSHAYFQTILLDEDSNTSVNHDLNGFDYTWLLRAAYELGWSTNALNMLFIGMPNVVTPLHYDIMENLFIQLQGKKRFILFSPDQYANLYPYPVAHPHDRQSQVDLEMPDYQRFPKFCNSRASEAILEPGDVLYVPTNWWHHVEANKDDITVSLNFWFEDHVSQRMLSKIQDSAFSTEAIPLTPAEHVLFKRHVESLVYNMTKNSETVKEIFEDILNGRFDGM